MTQQNQARENNIGNKMRSSIEMKIIKKNQPETLELKNAYTMHNKNPKKTASTSDNESKQEEEKSANPRIQNVKTEGLNG